MLADSLLNRVLWARMQLLRWSHWQPLVNAARRPAKTQRQLLLGLVRRNGQTQFGREHHFESITSYDDFAKAVPIQTYETLRPYIEKQERTGEPTLNADRPVMYAQTSGTTGQPKLIPVLRQTIREHKRSQAIQSWVQFSADAQAYYGRFLAIVSPAVEGTLETGTPYGSTSGFMYENMPALAKAKYVLPPEVFGVPDYDLKYRLILRLALPHRNITHIACANPSTLVKLLSVLAESRTVLLRDVADETFSGSEHLAPKVRAVIATRLSCRPGRLDELRMILDAPQPAFAQLWPELRLLSTWTGGSCQIPLAGIRSALPPHTRIAELGYLSSELRGTLVVDLARNAGIPTIHENFFEFVEQDDWEAGRQRFRTIDALEPDTQYYVFPTTGTGLYRYAMNDIIRVTGSFHGTPTIEFVQKGKGVTNITGEKLYEGQVVEAVRAADDATEHTSSFFILLADAEQAVYRLVIECPTPTEDWCHRMRTAVDDNLATSNVEYAAKRASGRLLPLELLAVRPGTGEAYKRYCLEHGQREGQFKLIALQQQSECGFPFVNFLHDGPHRRER